ncbi:MAG: hypothetical protein PHT78_08660 [Desulfitobacteriaceae bacterium]|nr:hypothetical protein [Desulfitobacteriaceae bacterium]
MTGERDKAKLQKELFLKKLEEMPVISAVCTKTNISKANIYRWKKEDPDFKVRLDEALKKGNDSMCDVAEYQLFKKVQEGNLAAIKYFLSNKHPEYIRDTIRLKQLDKSSNQFEIILSTVDARGKKKHGKNISAKKKNIQLDAKSVL